MGFNCIYAWLSCFSIIILEGRVGHSITHTPHPVQPFKTLGISLLPCFIWIIAVSPIGHSMIHKSQGFESKKCSCTGDAFNSFKLGLFYV